MNAVMKVLMGSDASRSRVRARTDDVFGVAQPVADGPVTELPAAWRMSRAVSCVRRSGNRRGPIRLSVLGTADVDGGPIRICSIAISRRGFSLHNSVCRAQIEALGRNASTAESDSGTQRGLFGQW